MTVQEVRDALAKEPADKPFLIEDGNKPFQCRLGENIDPETNQPCIVVVKLVE